MSIDLKGKPRPGAESAARGVLWLMHAALGRWMALIGFPLLAIGAGFLAGAWQIGPQAWSLVRALEVMSVSADARSIEPFWRLDADMNRVREDGHWSNHADLRLCLTAEYRVQTDTYRRIFCGLPRQVRAPDRYGVHDMQSLLEGMDAVWLTDARGNPVLSLRIAPDLHAWLASREAAHWMLSPQVDAIRDRFPPAGTELDYLLLEFDRPIEWLAQLWPADPETVFELRYDPDRPEQAFPAVFVDHFGFDAGRVTFAGFLALVGLVLWGYGVVFLLYDQPRSVRLVLGCIPLMLLPWWSGALGSALRWSDSQAYYLGLDFMREVMMGNEREIAAHAPTDFDAFVRLEWPALGGASYYAPLLAAVDLQRPVPFPVDPDAALRAAAEQTLDKVRALSDEEARDVFAALTWAELIDRGEIGLLFIPAARETALDAGRAEMTRQAATEFLTWLTISPIMPRRNDRAFEERIALWRSLSEFPPAPGVAHSARTLVERASAK